MTTAAERERAEIVAWLRGISNAPTPAKLFTWRNRLLYAWWGLRNPSVSMIATRISIADALERGDHVKGTGDER